MYQPRSPYTRIALETIKHALQEEGLSGAQPDPADELLLARRACFVSLHGPDGRLRGCVGTLQPQEKNLADEIRRNALSAAFHDSRFAPVTADELDGIQISVDVLSPAERIYSADDLDPRIFGLIISDGKYRRGVLLPAVPTIDSVEKQIDIVKRKAGLTGADERDLEYYRFSSNRYH